MVINTKIPFFSNLNCFNIEELTKGFDDLISLKSSLNNLGDISSLFDKNGIFCLELDLNSSTQEILNFSNKIPPSSFKVFFLPQGLEHAQLMFFEYGAMEVFTFPYNLPLIQKKLKNMCLHLSAQRLKTDVLQFPQLTLIPNKMQIDLEQNSQVHSIFMTPTQFRILYFLAQEPNKVRSRKEIMDNIFSSDTTIERNIDTHISKIRKHLRHKKNSIVSIHGMGYKFSTI